jgi:hypothetical protein
MLDQKPDQKLPADYWTTAEVMKEIFETKLCLAKSHSPDPCGGKIIGAHTIPRSQMQQIATDGHVYAIHATAGDLARNDGELTAKKIGIGKFSVLNAFCATHDNNVFKHVEDEPLVFDAHQLTLLHYRTAGSELYRKVMSYYTLLHQLEEQQKKKPRNEEAITFLTATAAGEQLGIRDIGTAFVRCATDLFAAKYDQVSALVVHFKKPPSVMTVGGFIPLYDYHGEPSQPIDDVETIAQTISFNILASEGHAAVAMLWFKDHDLVKPFAESYVAQKPEHYATLAVQTAFEFLENTCMQPTWWEAEPPIVRKLLLQRMQTAGTPFEKRQASCLTYCGVTFDQWDYDRHEYLNVN